MQALLVIDVQQGMFSVAEFQPYDGEAVVQRIAGLIEKARASETKIFFVQHDGGPGHPLAKGSAGFPFRPELAPRDGDDVTVKHHCNSFQATDLDAKLKQAGIDHLVVCGMQSEYCVDTAVRAAFERGYGVTLVSDRRYKDVEGPRYHCPPQSNAERRLREAQARGRDRILTLGPQASRPAFTRSTLSNSQDTQQKSGPGGPRSQGRLTRDQPPVFSRPDSVLMGDSVPEIVVAR